MFGTMMFIVFWFVRLAVATSAFEVTLWNMARFRSWHSFGIQILLGNLDWGRRRMVMPRFHLSFAAAMGLSLAAIGNASAASCLPVVLALGAEAQTKSVAESRAVKVWKQKVMQQSGVQYAIWRNAQQKRLSCPQNPDTGRFGCKVSAKPCVQFVRRPIPEIQ
jgi:hypothetical protein